MSAEDNMPHAIQYDKTGNTGIISDCSSNSYCLLHSDVPYQIHHSFCTNEHKCKARSGYPANVNCETGQAAARSEYANQYFSDYYYDDDMEDDIDGTTLFQKSLYF